MSDSLISIKNCRVQDLHTIFIDRVDWEMRAGEAWLVIGEAGSGKSAFLQALSGEKELVQNADAVKSGGSPDASVDAPADTGSGLGAAAAPDGAHYTNSFASSTEIVSLERAARLIEEERELDETDYMDRVDEGRTARRFICEVLGGPDAKHKHAPLPAIADRLETLPEVKLCGVERILDRGLRYLSTGEIRRTLLCRALLSGKKLLILSDPFAGLDAQSRTILCEFFQTIAGKQKNAPAGDMQTTRILLSMERYSEIPETITHVLEFAGSTTGNGAGLSAGGASVGAISFCGTRADYEALLKVREKEAAQGRKANAHALESAFAAATGESAIVTSTSERAATGSSEHATSTPDGSGEVLIDMRDVNVGWGGHQVLSHLNWSVKKGEHTLIRGPNGSGKTTLLELITGDNKQVYCNDVRLFGIKRGSGESIWDIKAKLGIVSYRLHVEYRMVGSTDLESVIISGFKDSIGLYEPKTDVQVAAARKWLSLAGFSGRENASFNSLSYGEQRAILILRASVKQPKVLILDEPCHGLDEAQRTLVLDLLEKIAETGTTTLLHVTHDPTEVLPCEKHVLQLLPGEEPMYRLISDIHVGN